MGHGDGVWVRLVSRPELDIDRAMVGVRVGVRVGIRVGVRVGIGVGVRVGGRVGVRVRVRVALLGSVPQVWCCKLDIPSWSLQYETTKLRMTKVAL